MPSIGRTQASLWEHMQRNPADGDVSKQGDVEHDFELPGRSEVFTDAKLKKGFRYCSRVKGHLCTPWRFLGHAKEKNNVRQALRSQESFISDTRNPLACWGLNPCSLRAPGPLWLWKWDTWLTWRVDVRDLSPKVSPNVRREISPDEAPCPTWSVSVAGKLSGRAGHSFI